MNRKKFFLRQLISTSLVIVVCYILTLVILESITKFSRGNSKVGLIIFIVMSSIYLALLIFFLVKEVVQYKRSNEKK